MKTIAAADHRRRRANRDGSQMFKTESPANPYASAFVAGDVWETYGAAIEQRAEAARQLPQARGIEDYAEYLAREFIHPVSMIADQLQRMPRDLTNCSLPYGYRSFLEHKTARSRAAASAPTAAPCRSTVPVPVSAAAPAADPWADIIAKVNAEAARR